MSLTITYNSKALVYFFLINFAISVFHIDSWNNANTTSRVLPIISYFEDGTFQIDKYHHLTPDKAKIGEHYYSDKAPLPTLMIIPVLGLLKSIGIISSDNGSFYGKSVYLIGALICGIIPFVLILCLTYIRLRRNNGYAPVLMSTLPYYASFIFIYAGTFYNHIISAFFLLLGYVFIKDKKYILAGVFSGLAFLCEYVVAIFIVLWVLQILWNERKIKPSLIFGIGVTPSIVFILLYNYHFTGSAYTMIYKFSEFSAMGNNYGFNFPTSDSLFGILFSSYKGMFYYAPVLVLILGLFVKKIFNSLIFKFIKLISSNYILLPSILVIVLISSYFLWWGGWSYGPRLLLFVAVLLFYEGLCLIDTSLYSKLFFWFFVLAGLILSIAAKITVLYSIPSEIHFPFTDLFIVAINSFEFNDGNVLTYFFGIKPFVANLVWLMLFPIFGFLLTKLKFENEDLKN